MTRRTFITLFGGAAAGWPLAASAQQPKMPPVGVQSLARDCRSHRDAGQMRRVLLEFGELH